MPGALSKDLRDRVLAAVSRGLPHREAASRFGVSASSVLRWGRRLRATGDASAGRIGGDQRSARTDAHAPAILALLDEAPDITLAELRAALAGRGINLAISTLWRFFRRRKITRKKRAATLPSRIGRTC